MIVAIETATEVCSAAVVHHSTVVSVRSLNERNIHSEQLMILINEVLNDALATVKDVDAIAVSMGPGSFTGLRIGLSTAKGLALSLERPIIAVPTLDGIAEAFRLEKRIDSGKIFCSLIDAKRNEAFYAFYSITENDIIRESEFSIKLKEEIAVEAEQRSAEIRQPQISASAIGVLAERRQKELEVSDFSYLEPLYLREFVTTTPKKKILH